MANTTGQNRVQVSAIPIGAATVTARKLYRTAANAAQLKLLTTIANNTATTYTDSTPDASLGANIPITDTSGLLQPAGQIPAGATTIPVAGTVAFQSTGGWAVIGNGEQVIRYTGLGPGSLTGIPASGIGAVTAAISFNSTITAAAMLTGIPASGARAIQYGLTAGGELYLVVQVDDTARQTALAASIGGGPGVREEWIQDRRLSITEARARGQATLAWRPLDHVTLAYRCRDVQTAAGQTVTATFPAPINISATLKLQTVTIDNFRPLSESAADLSRPGVHESILVRGLAPQIAYGPLAMPITEPLGLTMTGAAQPGPSSITRKKRPSITRLMRSWEASGAIFLSMRRTIRPMRAPGR